MAASVTIGEGATVPATGNVTVKGKNVGKSGGKRNDRAQKVSSSVAVRPVVTGANLEI